MSQHAFKPGDEVRAFDENGGTMVVYGEDPEGFIKVAITDPIMRKVHRATFAPNQLYYIGSEQDGMRLEY